jgi:hypothetical protein
MILDVIRKTRRSSKIRDIAKDFIAFKNISTCAALHWRYDLKDWLNLQTGKKLSGVVEKIKSIRVNPTVFCTKIIQEMTRLNTSTLLLLRKGIN